MNIDLRNVSEEMERAIEELKRNSSLGLTTNIKAVEYAVKNIEPTKERERKLKDELEKVKREKRELKETLDSIRYVFQSLMK